MTVEPGCVHSVDCVKGMAGMPPGTVDLAFADPPFNIGYDYDAYDDRRAADEYLAWSRSWIEGVIRVLKPNGTFWLAIGDEFAAELKLLCTRELGLCCRSWVVWFYTFGVHCTQKFTRSHAHLFHFVRDPKNFTFNSLAIRVPSARQLVYADKRANPDGRVPDDTWMTTADLPAGTPMRGGFVLRPQDIPDRFPPHSDTWYFSRVAGTFGERRGWHGCQMPEQILGRVIRACSNKGDVVFDPFAGSGTTLAVAKKLRRQFVGFELSRAYAKKIEERLRNIKPGDALIGPENPARSAPATKVGRAVPAARRRPAKPVCASPVVARANATLGQVAVANREYATAIAEAFIASHQGYSADRVVADPALNERFWENCERLSIPGAPADWNRLLFNLRKRGGLKAVDTSRRTRIPSREITEYMYASEIAWRLLNDRTGDSLDDILCDPERTGVFDQIAARIAPGKSPFEYRWTALALRKMFALGNPILKSVRARLDPRSIALTARTSLPAAPAHYVISVGETRLYVGFADCLAKCLFFEPARIEAAASELDVKDFSTKDVNMQFQLFNRADHQEQALRVARRVRLVRGLRPIGNILNGEEPERAA
ncbi:MAG TPA: site-specific DNA-methyltransferase [Phycisphaerae bacterium]|nr:site-specific DNA-methyltransferase [Phycisphaerae bacterium]